MLKSLPQEAQNAPKMRPKCAKMPPRCLQDAQFWPKLFSTWLNLAQLGLPKPAKTWKNHCFFKGFGHSAEWHISPHLTWSQNWHQPPSWSQNGSEMHIRIHTYTYIGSSILNHSNALPVHLLRQVFWELIFARFFSLFFSRKIKGSKNYFFAQFWVSGTILTSFWEPQGAIWSPFWSHFRVFLRMVGVMLSFGIILYMFSKCFDPRNT